MRYIESLVYTEQKGMAKFLREMMYELEMLNTKYNAEADLRNVWTISEGEKNAFLCPKTASPTVTLEFSEECPSCMLPLQV